MCAFNCTSIQFPGKKFQGCKKIYAKIESHTQKEMVFTQGKLLDEKLQW